MTAFLRLGWKSNNKRKNKGSGEVFNGPLGCQGNVNEQVLMVLQSSKFRIRSKHKLSERLIRNSSMK